MRNRPVMVTTALLLAGALGVHELRYPLAFGDEAGSALAHHGHGYVTLLPPLLGALIALGLAAALVRAAAAPAVRSPALVRVRRLWPAGSAALLAIYVGNELLEGVAAAGASGRMGGRVRLGRLGRRPAGVRLRRGGRVGAAGRPRGALGTAASHRRGAAVAADAPIHVASPPVVSV